MFLKSWYSAGMDIVEIKQKAVPILKASGVTRSSLFGSRARGDAREDSDIDMLIEFPKGKSLLDLISLERKLMKALGKKVDLATYKSVSPLLQKYIQQDELSIL